MATAGTAAYGDMTHDELVEVATRHEAALERMAEESRRVHAQMRAQETKMAARIAEAAAMASAEKERAAWHAGRLEEEQAKVARLQSQVNDLELQLQLHTRQQAESTRDQEGQGRQTLPELDSEVDDDVPSWRTRASSMANTIDIGRPLPSKQGKQGTRAAGSAGGQQAGQPRATGTEMLIAYASCQFDSEKKLFADLKRNDKGRYIKLAVAADGSRQHVILPADSWNHLSQMIDAHS
jgi:hypothetical protein